MEIERNKSYWTYSKPVTRPYSFVYTGSPHDEFAIEDKRVFETREDTLKNLISAISE